MHQNAPLVSVFSGGHVSVVVDAVHARSLHTNVPKHCEWAVEMYNPTFNNPAPRSSTSDLTLPEVTAAGTEREGGDGGRISRGGSGDDNRLGRRMGRRRQWGSAGGVGAAVPRREQ